MATAYTRCPVLSAIAFDVALWAKQTAPSRRGEHVFGTLKAWTGSSHFLTRTLPRVRTEMSSQVLAYNLKRAIKILGAKH